jgi:N-acetylglucosamine malate deacetylase 1
VRFAARNRHRLPSRLLGTVVELATLLPIDAPLAVLPAVRRVLVVAPHPDDETIGCGGTIARLAAAGAKVDVVVVTDGEATIGSAGAPEVVAARRRQEVNAACALLGAQPPTHLGLPDGRVSSAVSRLAEGLQRALERTDPQLLLVPWVLEAHPDHRAVTAALAQLDPCGADLWGYEAHTPIPLPDRVIDISRTADRKREALRAHATAGLAFELEASLGLARWRSLSTRAGAGHAEAFLTSPWDILPDLVRAAARAWVPR